MAKEGLIEMRLEGAEKLNIDLQKLELKVRKKVRAQAVRAAAKPVLEHAKSNALSVVGGTMGSTIYKALQLKAGKPKSQADYFLRVQHSSKYNNVFVGFSMGAATLIGGYTSKGKSTKGRGVIASRTSGNEFTLSKGGRHYIPNAIEFGHALPGQAGGAKVVRPMSYMRKAMDSNIGRSDAIMRMKLLDGIERAWRVG